MSLKDVLIMEVPSGVLKQVLKNEKIDAKLTSLEEMAEALYDKKPQKAIELANQFQFAGSTAVNLNIIMSGIGPEWYNKNYFKKHLEKKFGENLFTSGIRPTLDRKPKLIQAYELGEKIVLAFSFLGPSKRYLENFQIVSRRPQIVEYVVIHFSPFAIEVRASHDQNQVFIEAVLDIMDIKDEVVWDKATKLTDEQANMLAKELGAKLRAAKHKMTEGVYATKEVTAHTQIDDLQNTEQYIKEFSNQPMKRKTLVFEYTYSFGYNDSISYVITDEGLFIRSKVGEEVISYILEKILKIRYPKELGTEESMLNDEYESEILVPLEVD
jgi:hypothetical protein